jgi:hypothetical protein
VEGHMDILDDDVFPICISNVFWDKQQGKLINCTSLIIYCIYPPNFLPCHSTSLSILKKALAITPALVHAAYGTCIVNMQ